MARTVDPQRVAERRAAILTAAASLFASNGFEGTTIAAVARKAGMSPGNVFHYFPDKAALFRGLFEQSIVEFAELVEQHAHRPDPVPALLDLIEAQVGEALDPVAPGLMVEVLRRVGHDDELTRLVTAEEELAFTTYRALLERADAAGDIDSGFDLDATARWLIAIVDAAFLHADPDNSADPRPLVRLTITRLLTARTEFNDQHR
ncbi:TetR/AcrR family transcriptional regulator [Rhodococcus sp. BL-253-APC-6A1W]|uniref:TetR/AcrR family transcriptional regulator n=1 Tax=Rhodococcus sp. BL-253-APC-6A1W TaxID=2725307 RepID=UPI00146B1C1E|nr:TetR/AcrR family transcriptional regulator [Rhodococcus sp. BL-253-APC-6A1W]NMD94056.1 TetR/AcrR family transcriptional regulator [Rhodococcus sp. BL-253-APC-6A1W]